MPTLNVTTSEAEKVWSSPDGQRKIYKVTLDFEGKSVVAKTYSEAIATEGWEGTVETYEKEGRNGAETFVKQPPKENSYRASHSTNYGGSTKSGYGKPSFDNYTMYLSYAKDVAVALLGTKDGFSEEKYAELLEAIKTGGDVLYDGRPEAKDESKEDTKEQEMPENFLKVDKVIEVTDDPITIEDLNKAFPGSEKVE